MPEVRFFLLHLNLSNWVGDSEALKIYDEVAKSKPEKGEIVVRMKNEFILWEILGHVVPLQLFPFKVRGIALEILFSYLLLGFFNFLLPLQLFLLLLSFLLLQRLCRFFFLFFVLPGLLLQKFLHVLDVSLFRFFHLFLLLIRFS